MLIVCILSISTISATENTANKEVTNTEINQETNIQYDDVSTSNINDELILEENNGRNEESGYRTDKTTATNEDPLTFTELNKTINDNTNSTIYLSKNYKYNNEFDAKFINGISINRSLTIYGNGVTLDGSNTARIFNVTTSNLIVKFYNITFKNGKADNNGGAIYQGNAYNCTFTENNAKYGGAIYGGNASNCTFTENNAKYGGAIWRGNASNCTFTENNADYGGAIYGGNAYNCIFTNNTAYVGGAIWRGNAYNCIFTENKANWSGGAISEGNATNCTFTNNNATLDGGAIYGGNAYNCTFTENKANLTGGAIYRGNATNCTFTGNNATKYGGAIYNGTATNCTFTGNTATDYGGAIGDCDAYNCIFTDNFAYNYCGGAIWRGNATNSTFTGNTATDYGGAICNGTATNCTFTENNARYGGAIYNGTATNCTFTENNARYGGAIYNGTATNCTFTENNATYDGGAIYNGTATNCTFTENNATRYGGAIYNGNATNCTFTNNTASNNGGAIYGGNAYNCIFIGNNALYGGAIWRGNARNCNFINNKATSIYGGGGAICNGNATNCTFTENNATNNGGAIWRGNATNCTFTENNATNGGAIYNGNATNCTFIRNTATIYGGAMYEGNAILCTFNGDTTYNTNIIPAIINVINYTSLYQSGERLKFNLTVNGTLYDRFNTTIKIYKEDGSLVKTVYGLTGEGWIVDLIPGEYVAVLSLTDYPEEKSVNATITVEKFNTTIDITPIIDAKAGKEIKINYTTNSNGTVTIKVNGEVIPDGNFTPPTNGTYNVTIIVAENEYYTLATSKTTFTVEKTNTTILISPIIDYVVGETIPITFTSNSNGTVTIKVNGQIVPDGNYTPTKAGTYNVTIEIAENDYYTAGSNETTFTVEKLATQITASPVTTTYNIGKYLVITLKDENGKPINNVALTVNLGSAKKYTTNANGQVKINVATLTPKTYTAKITYAGSDSYKGSTHSAKVTVKKATPKITAKSASFKLTVKTKKYTATFKDNKNKVLKNTKVTLKVNGKTYSVKTNNKGQGVFKITNLNKKGSYSAVITVPTNTYYNKVTKNVKITVKQ